MYQNLLRHRVGLYEKALPNELSWEDKLKQTKELGFDFLEISVDESDERRSRLDWNDEEVYALRHLCEKHGVPLQSMCLSAHRKFPFGSADPAIREQALSIWRKLSRWLTNWVFVPSNWLGMTFTTSLLIK